jgi:hypothetical protein
VAAVNTVLYQAAADTGATVLPYHDLLCDGNEPRDLLGGPPVRPDGVHFGNDPVEPGADLVWAWIGQELVDRDLV